MTYSMNKQITCYQTQRLVDVYILNDPSLTAEERRNFEIHIQNCDECACEYEKAKRIIGLISKYWSPASGEALAQPQKEEITKRLMTLEEGWQDLLRRCPDLAKTVKRQKRQQLLRRVSAVAACLVIGVSIFLAFSIYSKPKTSSKPAVHQIALAPKPSVKTELVSKNGSILIPTNQQIVSSDELKTLIINGKHRLMMNTNTVLAVESLVENSHIGCLVKLTSGQIYAHVEHYGNPFVVETAHGKAVITGTTFDVKSTESSTMLVVSEGTVQFESEKGVVEVAAGQTSCIVGQSAPTKPVLCNAAELTMWATGYKVNRELAKIESIDNTCLTDFPLPVVSNTINLESIDYEDWVEKNRDWFKREFPWIFQLKEALAKEGIEVDYPELLIQSGDIWQFVFPGSSATQISIIKLDSLLKVNSYYGFNKEWLLKNVPAAKSAIDRPVAIKGRFTGLEAFEEWIGCFEEVRKSPKALGTNTILYSLHACNYLANTRTLIWLCVKNGHLDYKTEEKTELLSLLQEQISNANISKETIIQLILSRPQNNYVTRCTTLLGKIVESIEMIYSYEKNLEDLDGKSQ